MRRLLSLAALAMFPDVAGADGHTARLNRLMAAFPLAGLHLAVDGMIEFNDISAGAVAAGQGAGLLEAYRRSAPQFLAMPLASSNMGADWPGLVGFGPRDIEAILSVGPPAGRRP